MLRKQFKKRLAIVLALTLAFSTLGIYQNPLHADSAGKNLASLSLAKATYPTGDHQVLVSVVVSSTLAYSSADLALSIEGPGQLVGIESKVAPGAQLVGPLLKGDTHYFGFFGTENRFSTAQAVAVLKVNITGNNPVKLTLKEASITSVSKTPLNVTKTTLPVAESVVISRVAAETSTQKPTTTVSPQPTTTVSPQPTTTVSPQPTTTVAPQTTTVARPQTIVPSVTTGRNQQPTTGVDLDLIDPDIPFGDLEVKFTDIQGNWAKSFIQSLASFGIIKGKTTTLFAPSDLVTRAEFVHLLMNALGDQTKLTAKQLRAFNDVPSGAYYEQSLGRAVVLGIVANSNSKFMPKEAIKRQDMMVMLHKAMKVQGHVFKAKADLTLFKDHKQIHVNAKGAIAELVADKVISGSNNLIRPLANLKRDEVAKVIFFFTADK